MTPENDEKDTEILPDSILQKRRESLLVIGEQLDQILAEAEVTEEELVQEFEALKRR